MSTKQKKQRNLFVTTALPYANGKLHLGHLLEYIQADVWVRAQRMAGNSVQFVCADDAHGAPIMIAAESAGMEPAGYVELVTSDRKGYLDGFHIKFDNWHSTHSVENAELSQDIYRSLSSAGMIEAREIEQFFDPVKGMFLPDRYIKGGCPMCGAKEQYGDSCEQCGSVYRPTELIGPTSVLTGAKPDLRKSMHFFFRLTDSRATEFLKTWVAEGTLQPEIEKKTSEWFGNGLIDWDISRDAPYFGIPIPDTTNKYFYVWLDAPVGYLASLKNHFAKGQAKNHWHQPSRSTKTFEEFISNPEVEQIHFIGKDIIYFHTLFWPAVLHFCNRKTPTAIFAHGHLTVNGEKMSKSRGNGIDPLKYLEAGMDPEWMRYYLATKLNGRVEDADFSSDDFISRVNADLVGKYVNIASRASGFITKRFNGRLGTLGAEGTNLVSDLQNFVAVAAEFYEEREFSKCVRGVMAYADRVNEFFDRNKPWELNKKAGEEDRLREVCTACIEAFRLLTICLKPLLPTLARRVEVFLNVAPLTFSDAQVKLADQHRIMEYVHLVRRADSETLASAFSRPL